MHSIREIMRIGRGPSSSHTMGPEKAAKYMLREYPDADSFRVTLYGSLAKTGMGHRTDYALIQTFAPKECEVIWDTQTSELPHPNTMDLEALKDGAVIGKNRILSIGGGCIHIEGQPESEQPADIYPENTLDEILEVCRREQITLPEYVYRHEDAYFPSFLHDVWEQMQMTVMSGLEKEGELPGGLGVSRRGKQLRDYALRERNLLKKEHFMISAYAYAACEENASGNFMVTSPTCGASGVLPAILFYEGVLYGISEEEVKGALAVAGILGCVIQQNASVSGAECGCQAEIGSACAMASGALAYLHGLSLEQIECAAEIAMEHCLGLTCDPVGGLVQIPCIERNAVAALRAYDAAELAEVVWDKRKISFDLVVRTMYETGKDLSACYRETSDGGLAKLYVKDFY